ncbi:MAG TPA: DUF1385 domain-containing protein [Coriobacteriia bacterium]|nr:DUF1385 domain-containing protein [Coriobacteriia bacterium]
MSDSQVTRVEEHVKHTHIGGQAVIEGVMMRGKYNWAIAVRKPDGEIHVEEHDLVSGAKKHEWMRWPIVRGCVALVETFSLAMKAFTISAEMSGEGEEEQLSGKEISLSLVMGGGLAILLFIVAPAVLTNFITRTSAAESPFLWNGVDGLLRVAAFFAYIWAISRMEEIQRVFRYHGAEHKVIHTFEHDLPLETPVIQKWSTHHMRCGTSFLFMVMIIAILVFSLVPVRATAAALGLSGTIGILIVAIVSRVVLLPVVAGLAYEVTVKWAGNHSENPFVKVLLWPGLQMQRMTTGEPDDSMVEVAVAAVTPVIERERREESGEMAAEEAPAEDALADSPLPI